MNKKGFTIVELLAVIVIFAIVIAIAVPAFGHVQKSIKDKQYENKLDLIRVAALKYADDTNYTAFYIDDLIMNGYLEADKVLKTTGGKTYLELDDRDNKTVMNCYVVVIEDNGGTLNAKIYDELKAGNENYEENGCAANLPNSVSDYFDIKLEEIKGIDEEDTDPSKTWQTNNTANPPYKYRDLEYNDYNGWWTKNNVRITISEKSGKKIDAVEWYEGSSLDKIVIPNDNYIVENPVIEQNDDGTSNTTYRSIEIGKSITGVLQQNYTAKIKIDGKEYAVTTRVYIDKVTPEFYMDSNKISTEWSKKVDYAIEAYDNESGLYSYFVKPAAEITGDCPKNRDEYSGTKTKSITDNGDYYACLIDNVGNVKKSELLSFQNIDASSPTCNIEIVENADKKVTILATPWYYENIKVKVTYNDTYIDNNGNVIDSTSNVKTHTVTINNTKQELTNGQIIPVTADMTKISAEIEDQSGNKAKCAKLYRLDTIQPDINPNASNANPLYYAYGNSKAVLDFFTIARSYGPTGGTTTCYVVKNTGNTVVTNNNTLTLGVNKIRCEMVARNSKRDSAEVVIRHTSNTSTFTCPSGYTISGNTCNKTVCNKWNCKTNGPSASCGCNKWKCKTEANKADPSCGCNTWNCKQYKTCLTECTADNGSVDDGNSAGVCASQTGTVSTTIQNSGTKLKVVWYNFKNNPRIGQGDTDTFGCWVGTGPSVPDLKIGLKDKSNGYYLLCNKNDFTWNSHTYSAGVCTYCSNTLPDNHFGIELNHDLLNGSNSNLTHRTTNAYSTAAEDWYGNWICEKLTKSGNDWKDSAGNKYSNHYQYDYTQYGMKLTVTINASALEKYANKRVFMLIGSTGSTYGYLQAYHSICNPKFTAAASCGCKATYGTGDTVNATTCGAYKTCNVCTAYYGGNDTVNTSTCSEYKSCCTAYYGAGDAINSTTCGSISSTNDNNVRSFYLKGTNTETGAQINATCNASAYCVF